MQNSIKTCGLNIPLTGWSYFWVRSVLFSPEPWHSSCWRNAIAQCPRSFKIKSRADSEYWERPDRNMASKWSFHRSGPAQKPVSLHTPGPAKWCTCFLGWRNPADGGQSTLLLCAHFVGRKWLLLRMNLMTFFLWVHSYHLQLSTAGKRGLLLTLKQLGKVRSPGLPPFRKIVERQAASTTNFFGLVSFLQSLGLVCCRPGSSLLLLFGRSVVWFRPSTEDQWFCYK